MSQNKQVHIYTDGSARGNPGPGGFGIVMLLVGDTRRREIAQGYQHTTNNRMELLAVIVALQQIKEPCDITCYTDSRYVSDAVNKNWLKGWEKKNFAKTKNPDLWIQFLKLYKQHAPAMVWVKGHADNKWNERCDVLATTAAQGNQLLEDKGYMGTGSLFAS